MGRANLKVRYVLVHKVQISPDGVKEKRKDKGGKGGKKQPKSAVCQDGLEFSQ